MDNQLLEGPAVWTRSFPPLLVPASCSCLYGDSDAFSLCPSERARPMLLLCLWCCPAAWQLWCAHGRWLLWWDIQPRSQARCSCFPHISLVCLSGVLGPVRDKWIIIILPMSAKKKNIYMRGEVLMPWSSFLRKSPACMTQKSPSSQFAA